MGIRPAVGWGGGWTHCWVLKDQPWGSSGLLDGVARVGGPGWCLLVLLLPVCARWVWVGVGGVVV